MKIGHCNGFQFAKFRKYAQVTQSADLCQAVHDHLATWLPSPESDIDFVWRVSEAY